MFTDITNHLNHWIVKYRSKKKAWNVNKQYEFGAVLQSLVWPLHWMFAQWACGPESVPLCRPRLPPRLCLLFLEQENSPLLCVAALAAFTIAPVRVGLPRWAEPVCPAARKRFMSPAASDHADDFSNSQTANEQTNKPRLIKSVRLHLISDETKELLLIWADSVHTRPITLFLFKESPQTEWLLSVQPPTPIPPPAPLHQSL